MVHSKTNGEIYMSNLNANTKRLVELYKDVELKASFTQNYLAYKLNLARIEEEYVWAFGTITRSAPTVNAPALSSLSNTAIKRILLSMSASGLSFNPQEKHFYLQAEIGMDRALIPKVIVGYLGMRQLAMNSGLVAGMSCDIVFESDSFTWYGNRKEPSFSSCTRNPGENVSWGFVVLYMKDGSINSYRMSGEELMSIQSNDIQMREEMGDGHDGSLYSGPWRERCLRIALWRCAFREFKHIFTNDKFLMGEESEHTSEQVNAKVFSDEFASALNSMSESVA